MDKGIWRTLKHIKDSIVSWCNFESLSLSQLYIPLLTPSQKKTPKTKAFLNFTPFAKLKIFDEHMACTVDKNSQPFASGSRYNLNKCRRKKQIKLSRGVLYIFNRRFLQNISSVLIFETCEKNINLI